ncbi:MAG: hypothetical protein IPL08_05805 [Saprospiraceae bacterium]|nr:hypothetical protein [Saprospiraceae bacterium]
MLIIIYPCKYSDELIKGEEGIFYDGLPTILQSVARLRTKGRILFTIPPMKAMIKSEMGDKLLKNIPFFSYDGYIKRYNLPKLYEEQYLKYDYHILKSYLKKKTNFVNDKIKEYDTKVEEINLERNNKQKSNVDRPKIQFPEESTFILEKGQEYLKYKSFKSGKFITPYVVWAALHDQYINCTLDKILFLKRNAIFINFETVKISKQLMYYYKSKNLIKHTIEFPEYFRNIKKILTSVEDIDKSGKVTHQKVYLKLDNKSISISKLIVKNDFYFAIVDCYFKMYYPAIATDIKDRTTYLKFAFAHSQSYNNKVSNSYGTLEKIIDGFLLLYKNKQYTITEIIGLPYFTDAITHSILDCIGYFKSVDDVIRIQLEVLKGSFWTFKKSTKNAIIEKFVSDFIVRGQRNDKNAQVILGRRV